MAPATVGMALRVTAKTVPVFANCAIAPATMGITFGVQFVGVLQSAVAPFQTDGVGGFAANPIPRKKTNTALCIFMIHPKILQKTSPVKRLTENL